MSIKLMSLVWELDLPPGEKLVLLALADQANDSGTQCWPSVPTIAKRSGQSSRTVQRAIVSLEKAGHLTTQHRAGTSTQYRVHPRHHVTPDNVSPVTNATPTPDTMSPKPSRTTKKEEEEDARDPVLTCFAAWNTMAKRAGLPVAEKLTSKRRAAMKARISDYTEAIILGAIGDVPGKPWLMGINDRNWLADFDWLLQPDSITRLREGKYNHGLRKRPANDQGTGARVLARLAAEDAGSPI